MTWSAPKSAKSRSGERWRAPAQRCVAPFRYWAPLRTTVAELRRTATINQIRAFLIEQGIAVRTGARALRNSPMAILENRQDEISPRMRGLITGLYVGTPLGIRNAGDQSCCQRRPDAGDFTESELYYLCH